MTDPVRRAFVWSYQQPTLLALITMLCWAGNFIAARGVRADVPPITLAMIRWVGAFVVLLPFAWPHLKRDLPTILRRWRIMLVLSVIGIACFNTFAYIGLQYTVAMNAVLLQSSMPVLIALVVFATYRETPTLFQVIGVAVSLTGVIYVVVRGDPAVLLTLDLNRGDLWLLAAMFSWAAYTAWLRESPQIHWLSFLVATFFIGCLVLSPFWAMELAAGRTVNPTWAAAAASLYMVLFPAVIAYTCYNRAVQLAGANWVAPFFHLIPVLGSILAILILGERIQFYHALGFVLVMSGIAIASRRKASGAPV
ncbi:MAG: DMT family transporter [Hyphomicrobiales bacterium]|nr:DMT family transporter [Hyphomicrobiales bacterium]